MVYFAVKMFWHVDFCVEHLGSPEPAVDAFAQEQSNAENRSDIPQDRKMSTVMATMWLGTKSGNLYIHSAMGNYNKCLAR